MLEAESLRLRETAFPISRSLPPMSLRPLDTLDTGRVYTDKKKSLNKPILLTQKRLQLFEI